MANSSPIDSLGSESRFALRLGQEFRRNGWRIKENVREAEHCAEMVVSKSGRRYLIQLKVASEGRRDRLVPLLAQALLEAQAIAKAFSKPAIPLAIVAAPRIALPVLANLERFLADNAPDAAAGFLDDEGLMRFRGAGLDKLNGRLTRRSRLKKIAVPESGQLFSDLNQWMLKVLLAPEIPAEMLAAPRVEYRNASQLALAADVSLMSAFRFIRQLRQEGFLDEEGYSLRIVRREELMRRWQAVYLRPVPDLPMRWIVRGGSAQRLQDALRSRGHDSNDNFRLCLGLFAAADALGKGFVHGVKPHLYVERLDVAFLKSIGLSAEGAEHAPDVLVRVPLYREAVFRAAVERNDVPVADILQTWLDASAFPARGSAQADELRKGVLAPLFTDVLV
jgi:hypothetical protein